MPKLIRKNENILVKQWWSQTPFDQNKQLIVPVFNLNNGEYTGNCVELKHEIFNLPLRRDIVHNVMIWRKKLFKKTTHVTRTKGTTAGSGVKPFKQKGTGRARQGNKRAPGRKGGGKAHGAVMRDYSYNIPRKLRLLGLKTMLSAKLAEGKIVVIESEKQLSHKTKELKETLERFGLTEDTESNLFVMSYESDENFKKACNNLKNINTCVLNRVNILSLIENKRIIFTLDSLRQLQEDLIDRQQIRYSLALKNYKTCSYTSKQERIQLGIEKISNKNNSLPPKKFDPSQPLDLKFKVLQDYVQKYEELKSQDKLDKYMQQRRKSRIYKSDI